jgi:thiosulfate/3-mercaptopyruvate sulfurtransferase
MKTKIPVIILFTIIASLYACGQGTSTGSKEPWTEKQLLDPAELAKTLNNPDSPQPYLFCIGPQAVIKGSVYIGPTREKANLDALAKELDKLPKNADIVIYCGCCPYANCPNVRPAFELLNKKQFTNHKLLDLPKNIKVNWIDKGYPVE